LIPGSGAAHGTAYGTLDRPKEFSGEQLGKFGPLMHQQIAIIVLLWIALQVPLGSAIGDWIRLGMVAKLKITSDYSVAFS
jgi:hypothetical protein